MKNKLIIIVAGLIVIGAGVFYFYHQKPTANKTVKGVINSATFYCAGDKNIQAIFFADKVELTLSDGRNMLLPQAVSASGARYANNDESFIFWNKEGTAFVSEGDKTTFEDCTVSTGDVKENVETTTPASSQMANPASVNCKTQGGTLVIQKRGDGGEYGLCNFEDNRSCEEWALMRGDCPKGGVKTTGYDTDAQKYCAWLGGKTLAVKDAICTFNDGSTCPDDEFYVGTCQQGMKTGQNENQLLPVGYTLKNYTTAETLDMACEVDTDCVTPVEYQMRSSCPYTSLCLKNKCTVVCPGHEDSAK